MASLCLPNLLNNNHLLPKTTLGNLPWTRSKTPLGPTIFRAIADHPEKSYFRIRRRTTLVRPIRPVPRSNIETGSGP